MFRHTVAWTSAALLFSALAEASTIVVANNSDLVNGDTSSPAALALQPGPDGISLREAIETANRSGSAQTIRFATTMQGQIIEVTGALFVTGAGLTIEGAVDPGGEPMVTLDGRSFNERRRLPFVHEPDLLTILASRFRLTGMRIQNVKHRAVVVQAGPTVGDSFDGNQEIRDIAIIGNVFDTMNFVSDDEYVDAIRVWTDVLGGAREASIRNLTVARNRIAGFDGNGIIVSASGDGISISAVTIDGNDISASAFPIEVNAGNGAGNVVADLRITNNRIRASGEYPSIFVGHVPITGTRPNSTQPWPPSVGNRIERSAIERNRMNTHIQIDAGTSSNGKDNVVVDTVISQNAAYGPTGIFLLDGDPDSSGNRLESVQILNNTMANTGNSALNAIHRGSANTMTGVSVRNSILIAGSNGRDVVGLSAAEVSNSITDTAALAGINGNRAVDPMLANAASGDLYLLAGSPAIDQATGEAPAADGDCRARAGPPDIGAFEFGAAPVARLTIEIAGNGTVQPLPAGSECGRSLAFAPGTTVRLQPGPYFIGWAGHPDCLDGVVLMQNDIVCEAHFGPPRRRAVGR